MTASPDLAALKKTNGNTDGDALIQAMKGMKWESPRGPISIDPETRDIVQNIYIRKVERSTANSTMSSSRPLRPSGIPARPRSSRSTRVMPGFVHGCPVQI